MTDDVENGARREIDGKPCVYYDGYWIRWYEPPPDTLQARKDLIVQLTRRTFHHTEAGINTPGERLEEARRAWERESDPARKRVKAAMLAGALFNRATDIFTTVVELAAKGVAIRPTNSLLRECSACFREALALGKHVRHYSGHEGIDELWGEPFKAFTMSIAAFYESRYIKIAQTMRDIDRITEAMGAALEGDSGFEGIDAALREFAEAAKLESETMKADPANFEVWPRFVAAGERLEAFAQRPYPEERMRAHQGPGGSGRRVRRLADERRFAERLALIREGKQLISWIAAARVPMPKSTAAFLEKCQRVARAGSPPRVASSRRRAAG